MSTEVYITTDAVALTSIPVVLANNSVAVGVTSIPTSFGVSTQAITVADRIVSGWLSAEIAASEIVQDSIKRKRNGRVVTKFRIRNKKK